MQSLTDLKSRTITGIRSADISQLVVRRFQITTLRTCFKTILSRLLQPLSRVYAASYEEHFVWWFSHHTRRILSWSKVPRSRGQWNVCKNLQFGLPVWRAIKPIQTTGKGVTWATSNNIRGLLERRATNSNGAGKRIGGGGGKRWALISQ